MTWQKCQTNCNYNTAVKPDNKYTRTLEIFNKKIEQNYGQRNGKVYVIIIGQNDKKNVNKVLEKQQQQL